MRIRSRPLVARPHDTPRSLIGASICKPGAAWRSRPALCRRRPVSRPPVLFDARRRFRARAKSAASFANHDFLHQRAIADILDRLESVTRTFDDVAVYGAGALAGRLRPRCGAGVWVDADLADSRLPGHGVAFDEEFNPIAEGSLDLAVSVLTLHAVNDPVGALAQWRRALRPDGLFLAAVFAENTLASWRTALYTAEAKVRGGVAPRVHPFAAVQDLGGALQRAGFALPVVDLDPVDVDYTDPARLLADLKGMGETTVLSSAAPAPARAVLAEAVDGLGAAGGRVRFDIAYLTGWAPHPSQQKPLPPGSAVRSMEAAVKDAGKT